MKPDRPVVLLWVTFGPYHHARAARLATLLPLHTVQFAGRQNLYGWRCKKTGSINLLTLHDGAYEEASNVRLIRTLWATLRALRPAVLLVPGYRELTALAAALWGRLHHCQNVLMTDSTELDHARGKWREWLKSCLVNAFFDDAIVSGRRAAEYLTKLGFPASRIATGYDVVDNQYFADETNALRLGAPLSGGPVVEPHFLYVGRLAPEKNLSSLLAAFVKYRAQGGTWRLVLVGRGPLEDDLRSAVESTVCDDLVQLAGFREGEDLVRHYAYASGFVLPSTREPWGLVVNEAMASGLPVIVSTRCGCSDELVEHGGNGFIFDPAREEELVDCMLRMSAMSDEERARMGQRSREIIANYSLERWASEVVRLVESERGDREAAASART
jgi:1,2-diacylglycerol 3-alpha-glucosyltransferase